MKTIICYPESLANSNSINISSWIISDYLEKQGYEVFYNEVPDGEDIDLGLYYDQLALYTLEDCLTLSTLKKIALSRHILHSYSSSKMIEEKMNDKDFKKEIDDYLSRPAKPGLASAILTTIHNRISVKSTSGLLQTLVWREFIKSKLPAAQIKKPLTYPQFLQLVKNE